MEDTSRARSAAPAARTIVLGLGALALVYFLAEPLVQYAAVVACALLLAVAISSLAGALHRRTRLPYGASVAVVVLGALGGLAALIAWTGPQLVDQMSELDDAVRRGLASGRRWLAGSPFGQAVRDRLGDMPQQLEESSGQWLGSLGSGIARGLGILTDVLLVVVLAVFVALHPRRYLEGTLRLVPPERRDRLREVAVATVTTLRAWLAARLFLMVIIGTAFGTALAILGVPLALPIGVLTAALAFIPFIGAFLSLVPALAVAFLEGPDKALQVLLVYLVIQLIETNLLDPLIESRAVDLPPALVLLAQVVVVTYFGAIGVLIATPLLVVVVVAVRMLYLEDRLGETAKVPHRGAGWLGFLRSHRHRTA